MGLSRLRPNLHRGRIVREVVREMCLDLAMGAHGTSKRGLVLTGEEHPPNVTATSFTTSAVTTSAADGGGAEQTAAAAGGGRMEAVSTEGSACALSRPKSEQRATASFCISSSQDLERGLLRCRHTGATLFETPFETPSETTSDAAGDGANVAGAGGWRMQSVMTACAFSRPSSEQRSARLRTLSHESVNCSSCCSIKAPLGLRCGGAVREAIGVTRRVTLWIGFVSNRLNGQLRTGLDSIKAATTGLEVAGRTPTGHRQDTSFR